MDVRSPLYQNIALILAGVLFLNPIVATAAQLAVDQAAGGNTSLTQAGNGVPVVNIATPNGSGLSHNKFTDYNVDQQGLILNNASDKLQSTQLGGLIIGNANLKNGAAGLILNEVTGGNVSQLRGYTEVAGRSAAVIVANPHGITCDGCGFINTPRVTLSTGTPVLEDGRLQRFDVNGGQISIEGQGLNADNVDQFDLITRSAKINAELYAKKLNIVTGRNQVDATTLAATAKADDGSDKPLLAIDSSALGGMYAGAIRLVGTEQGVGVKLAGDMAASAGDIQIDANGKLSLAQTSASGNLTVKAGEVALTGKAYAAGKVDIGAQGQLDVQQSLAAAGDVQLKAGQVLNQGVIEAGVKADNSRTEADLSLDAQQVRNAGTLTANRQLQVKASQRLDNQGGTLSAKGATQISAGQVDNRAGRVLAGRDLKLSASALDNRQGGLLHSQGAADMQVAGALQNQQGKLVSQGALGLNAGSLDNRGGKVLSAEALQMRAKVVDNGDAGVISTQADAHITAGSLRNAQAGEISAAGTLQLDVQQLDNSAKGIISSAQALTVKAEQLDNRGQGLISSSQALDLSSTSLDNSGAGQVISDGDMRLSLAGSLSNGQQGLIASQRALRLEASAIDNQDGGELSSGAALSLQGASLDNRGGLIVSDAALELQAREWLDNSQGGALASAAALSLEAGQLSNHDGGVIQGDGGVQAKVQGAFDNRAGSLLSGRDLLLVSGALDNRAGTLSSAGALQVRGSSLNASAGGRVVANGAVDIQLAERFDLSAGGRLLSGAAMLLRADTLDNHDRGLLFAKGDAVLEAGRVDNRQGGEISSKGDLSVQVDELDNREQGRLIAEAGLKLVADRVLNSALGALSAAQKMQVQTRVLANAGGRVLSGAALELSATQLDNQAQGRISAAADLSLLTEQLDNQQRGEVRSGGTLTLHAKAVDAHDQGLIAAAGAATVVVDEALDLSQGGRLIGEAALALQAGSLSTHQQGLVAAKGDLQVEASSIDNGAGGEMSTQGSLTLTADRLDNQDAGRVIAQAGLNATVARVNNQRSGVLASNAALLLHAKQIDNSVGGALSGAQLLTLQADSLDNQGGGRVLSGGASSIVLQQLNNSEAGLLSSRGDLLLQGNTLNNRAGSILVDGKGKVQADSLDSSAGGQLSSLGDLEVEVASLDQHEGGELLSKGQLELRTTTLDNRDGLVSALGLNIQAGRLSNQGGELSSAGSLSIEGEHLDNSGAGKVLADGALNLKVAQLLNQAKGVLSGANGLSLQGVALNNSAGGRLLSQGAIDLTLTGQLNNREGGSLLAQGPLRIKAASLDNAEAGLLSSQHEMALVLAGELDNQGGALIADGALSVQTQGLDNRHHGVISGQGNLALTAQQIDNRTGRIVTEGRLELDAEHLDNSQGQVASKGDLALELDQLVQQGGELLSEGRLDLDAGSLDNSQAGVIAATQGLAIRAESLNNSAKGEVSSQGAVALDLGELNNSDAGLVLGDAGLRVTVKRLLNHSLGLLAGRTGLVVRADSLDNSQGGTLTSEHGLDLQVSGLLDNHDQGALLSEGALQVRAGTLNNAAGVLSSAGELTLDSGALNNQGGKLVTDAKLTLDSSSLDNSQGGRISARQALNIETGTLDNQQKGLISGGAEVTVQATTLDNHGKGRIAGKGTVQVSATALDQHDGGELISESALTLDLQGGDLDNSGQGLIATPGALLLKNLGKVDNSAGGEISSSQGFLLKASELNNSAGRVISTQALQLQITQLLNNSLKGVLSGGGLEVKAASLDNSAAGVMASKGDMLVKLTGKLDNHDLGTLSAAQALTVEAAELDNANAGLLASGADLQVTTDALNNQGGRLLSQAGLVLVSGDLDNRDGVISSRQALNMTAGAVDNRDNGLITSADTLKLTASRLDSSRDLGKSGGELSAKKDLQLTVTELIQRQGRLIGEAGVRIDLKGGDLDNRGGLLTASGPLSLLALGKLDNRDGGEISSKLGYQLHANTINNGEQGRIISAGKLGLDVGTGGVRNAAGGLISGWQGVDITAGSLDNSARGTVSSRDGALTVKLDGKQRVLDNSGEGALVSKGKLEVEATRLDNSAKGIVSSGGDLDLRLSGTLDNSGHGLIDTQGSLTVNAGAVNNNAGQIGSGKAASLDAASLDNQAGQFTSGAALDLTLTDNLLNGQQGKLASAGPLVLKAKLVNNQSGSLISQNLLELTASSLNNADGGTIAARNGLSLLLTGALNNTNAGLIHSQLGSIGIRAERLDNNAGSLSSQGDLLLTLDGKLDNRSGQLQSRAGNLDLKRATSVDNQSGVLSSLTGWLKLVSSGLFDNDGGTTQAQTLDIEAKGLNNRGGHISALAGNTTIDLGRTTFNNQGGGLYAHQLLDVTAGDFNNQGEASGQGGKVAAERIDFGLSGALNNTYGLVESASSLSLTSTGLDNRFGSLRALGSTGDTRITASSLDNRNGYIETANTNLVLDAASLQSSGGRILHVGTGNFGLSAAQVMGAGGDLSTNGLLSLTADSWINSGVLQAGRLVLNIGNFTQTATGQLLASQSLTGSGGNWINDGLLASDGNLSLDLTGAYSGAGQVTSLGDLSLKATSIDLVSAARINGGGVSSVSSSGTLTNRGRLTSASDLTVSANTLNNYGTLGSGETLRLVAPNLLNERGLIFSGDDMALRVGNFTNRYGDVYSLGDINFSKDDAGSRAESLSNISGTLESAGDFKLFVSSLRNDRDQFATGSRFVSGNINVYSDDRCKGKGCELYFTAVERYEDTAVSGSSSPLGTISAGRDFIYAGDSFDNRFSVVSAGRDISIASRVFTNTGAGGGEERHLRTGMYTRDRGAYSTFIRNKDLFNKFNNPAASAYNPGALTVAQVMAVNAGYYETSRYTVKTSGSVVAQAIVQAGGAVNINASERLDNSVVRSNATYNAGSTKVSDARVGNTGVRSIAALASQLPPDLQQQQVNPLTLPGFALPQGENGLFRLSNQQTQSATAKQTQTGFTDRTLGGRSITLEQQERSLASVDAQGHSFAVAAQSGQTVATVDATDRQVQASVANLQAGGTAATVSVDTSPLQSTPDEQAFTAPSAGPGGVQPARPVVAARAPSFQASGITAPAVESGAVVQDFNVASPANHKYLIETNPALTDLKQFVSSDYLLGNLGYDPDQAQKRLGDGLYEQRLVREAIVARTGQRYLAGLTSDEAMFRYLMDNAVASKDRLGLSLGVTLSAEQVAALTHDIVWLEEHEVAGEKVLVPVLYLAQAKGRLATNGALIQGRDVTLISGGELVNQGTLRASENLTATAGNINNSGLIEAGNRLQMLATDSIRNAQGGVITGRDVSLTALTGDVINERSVTTYEGTGRGYQYRADVANSAARIEALNDLTLKAGRDIHNIGGALTAERDLALSAGRDVLINSQQEEDSYAYQRRRAKGSESSVVQHMAEARAGRDISVTSARDVSVIASQVSAERDLALAAGGDVFISSAANESHEESRTRSGRKKTTIERSRVTQQGAELSAGGDLAIKAGDDLTVVASELKAGDEAYLYAANDLSLLAAENTSYDYFYSQKKKKGVFSSSSKTRARMDTSSEAQGSLVSADVVELLAKNDMRIHGSDVVSTDGTSLLAGNDIDIRGVTESTSRESFEAKKKSGLMGSGGIGITLGSSSLKGSQKSTSETTRASTVGSVQGDVEVEAGKKLSVIGSDVVAGRDIALKGQEVVISAAQNQNRSEQRQESKKSGLTLALSGSVGSALNSSYESAQAARESEQGGDSRMAALQGVKAGLSGYQAMQAAEMGGGITAENASQFFGISVSLGTQKSSSKQVQEQQLSQGSNVNAGRDLSVEATGSQEGGGDLRVTGSRLQAGRDLGLKAAQDIQLEAAADTQKLTGSNKSGGGSVGVSFGFSDSGAGLSIFANANVGKGSEKGNGTTWSETTVDAGRQVSLDSGRDTRLAGSQVSGESIAAKVGRDMELRSLQDSDKYDAKQQNVSAGGSFTFGTMTGSGYVSANQNKLKSRYDSVQEQTGLFAGQGGYQIDVGKHTQLDGAVIGSTAEADKNRLSTGTLGWSDIRNKAEFSSQQQSVGVSSSGGVGQQFLGNMAGGLLSGLSRGGKDSSATRAAVSEGTVEIRDTQNQQQDVASLNRDVEHAHEALSPIFDKEKEQRRLREVQAIAEIGGQVMDVVRTEGQIKANRAGKAELERKGIPEPGAGASPKEREAYQTALANTKAYKDAMAPYGTGGDYQRVAQAVTAALQGLAGGNINGAIAGAAAPYVAQTIKQVAGNNDTARAMAHAVLGAVVAQAQGNSAGAGAAGAVTGELMAGLITKQLYGGVEPQDLTEEQKQTVSALSTLASGLAGAVVGGDAANAVAGAQGGRNAVENNFLSDERKAVRDKLREALVQDDYTTEDARKLVMSEHSDQLSDELLRKYATNSPMTPEESRTLAIFLQVYLAEQIKVLGPEKAHLALAQLLLEGSKPKDYYPYAGTTRAKDEFREANGYPDWQPRDLSENERIYQQAIGSIRTGNVQEGMAKVGEPALYFLSGGLGATIRTIAAANGAFQFGVGAGQAAQGDYWNAAGNMLSGVMGVSALAIPGTKVPVLKDAGGKPPTSEAVIPKWDNPVSRTDGDFGPLTHPVGTKETASLGISNAEMGPFVPQLSRYEDRIKLTPVKGGAWTGVRGESNFVFDNPDIKKILPSGIAYKNGYPDFSPITLQEVRLSGLISTDRDVNFRAANQMLANKLGVKESDVARFMREQKYTWHEVEDMRTMQLVPSFIHTGKVGSMDFGVKYGHLGGVAEKALLEALKK